MVTRGHSWLLQVTRGHSYVVLVRMTTSDHSTSNAFIERKKENWEGEGRIRFIKMFDLKFLWH